MKKSLQQLRRDARSGKLWMKCIEYYGKTGDGVPARMRMPRNLVDANTVDIFFLTPEGDRSACRIPRANLVEYTDTYLTVYTYGVRELTHEERKAMDEWIQIESTDEFEKRQLIDCLTDGSSTYWQKKQFFIDKGVPWLFCCDGMSKYGKDLDYSTGKVKDMSVRGEPILKYVIC